MSQIETADQPASPASANAGGLGKARDRALEAVVESMADRASLDKFQFACRRFRTEADRNVLTDVLWERRPMMLSHVGYLATLMQYCPVPRWSAGFANTL